MSDATPNLGLPLIAAAQAQKHVTHNEALGLLDALVQLACLDKDLAAPPASPADGDRYLVTAAAPTGAWAGLSGQVVRFADGVWTGSVPRPGWFAYVVDEADLYVFDGRAWTSFRRALAALVSAPRFGINTDADPVNRLAVKSDAALLSWDDVTPGSGDMRVAVNKRAPARDAGLVFQTGYAARALLGLLGSDDFSLKVSPDGTSVVTALTAAAATGVVGFPASPVAPTPPAGDGSTRLATTAYADRAAAAGIRTRVAVADAAYAVQPGDRVVAVTALTAPRTLTLPPAAAFPPGAALLVLDESGACSAARAITLARAGADTVNGAAAAAICAPYGVLALASDGASRWTVIDQAPGMAAAATLAQGGAGADIRFGVLEQLVPLSGTAVVSSLQIPNRAIVFAVSARVVAAVTGAPAFGVGVAGNPTQFGGGLGPAAGATNSGVIGPTAFYAPTPLVVTAASGSFTGGAVRLALHHALFGPPTG
ncbi:DUF2793 domain-containing protein [Methylobacterium sp. NEAU 140]|uniref:DUF2793 domain-containing protein n=1 Tax=Methylobacterium sp. NEAU 140 TaxID=3064945 RepID=UPI002732D19E|nr:DUF2793 domain-containing protein [Methylobacterium sp. NEAU 140]MDP4021403.1 DUF2793 domain-containing protein [Methylobacterium sp. NEAU 140]